MKGPVPDSVLYENQWDAIQLAIDALGIPTFVVPGNHDARDPLTLRIFERPFGGLPQAVRSRGVRFLLLNSTGATVRPGVVALRRCDE